MAKSRARKLADIIVGAGIDIDGNLTFDGGSTSADLTFADNDKANFGDASDLQIYHDGSNSWIKDTGTGSLLLTGSTGVFIRGANNENSIQALEDGAVNLYYDGNKKFETTSTGVKVTGNLTADDNQSILLGTGSDLRIKHDGTNSIISDEGGGDLIFKAYDDFYFKQVTDDANILRLNTGGDATFYGNVVLNQDNSTLSLGASSDLSIFHDGTDSFIKNDTGQLILRVASVESALVAVPNGAVSLYYDNSAKLATFSGGVSVTGQLNATTMHLPDGSTGLQLGASNDTKFFHDGSNSKITHSGSGGFYIGANTFAIQKGDHSENYLAGFADGTVEIYHNGTKKFETTSSGIQVTGNIDFPSSATILGGGTDTNMTIGTSSSGYQGLLKLQATGDIQLFQYGTSWTTNVTFKGDGQVGIGTTSPQSFVESSRFVVGSGTSGTNEMMFLYSGTNAFGAIGFADGTSGTERYRGIIGYHHDGDEMFFSTNGGGEAARDVTITSAGSVGIGTDSPSYRLHVYHATNDAPMMIDSGSANGAQLRFASSGTPKHFIGCGGGMGLGDHEDLGIRALDNILFSTGGTANERMRIDSSGNVGIGTTSPGTKLAVKGTASFIATNSTNNWMAYTYTDNTFRLNYNGAGADEVIIDSSGNVGIGAVSLVSGDKLTLNGNFNLNGTLFNGTSNNSAGINFTSNFVNHYGYAGIRFYAQAAGIGSMAERMRIDSNGNVGIGTSSPASNLHIKTSVDNSVSQGLIIERSLNSDRGYINYTGGGFQFRSTVGDPIVFGETDAEHVRILPDGNVGIGTTSPYGLTHWQDSSTINLIATNTGADGQADTTVMSLIGQARGYSNNIAKLANIDFKTDPNTWYRGVMTFNVAGYDGTDPSRTPIEAMRIDSGGNVGIGTGNTIRAPLQVHNSSTGAGSTEFRISRSVDSSAVNRKIAIIMGTDAANLGSTWKIESESSNGYNDSANLNFIHNAGGSPSTRVTFKANGNVGIGTDSPAVELDLKRTTNAYPLRVGSSGGEGRAIVFADVAGTPTKYNWIAGTQYNVDNGFEITPSTAVGGYTFGTPAFVVRQSGNVGIGTTSPNRKLEVTDTSGYQLQLRGNNSFWNVGVGWAAYYQDYFLIANNTGDKFVIDPNGNVGIGTNSPAGRLHLRGTTPHLYIQSDDGQSAKLLFGDATDNSRGGIEYMSTDDMKFMNNNLSTVMTLRYTGQVGIGETNPNQDAAVEISKAAPNTGVTTLRLTNSVNNKGQRIDFEDDNAARAFTISHDNGSNLTYMGNLVNEPFDFYTNSTERMRIQSGGDVRIGDTDGIYNSNSTSYIPFNTSGRFVTISDDDGAFLNLQSEATSSEQLGGILWTNRTGASDAHRQVASIDATTVDTTNSYEGGQLRFWTKVAGSAHSMPSMVITHNRVVKGNDSEFLGFEDAINILNADPENGGTDFDQTPTNNADGGGTTWEISDNGDAIYFSSTSGGHGGTWMKVYCDPGIWAIKGSVRLTNTDGAIHPSTSSANYKFTHSFQFSISSGPDTGTLKWDADAAASNTGTDFTRAAFSSAPVYMSGGYKTITYQTNGYNGIQRIYITDLQLVKVG